MRNKPFTERIARLGVLFTLLVALAACDQSQMGAVKELVAQQPEFGAKQPPLPPLEQRAPQFSQVFADVAEQLIPVVVSIRKAELVQVPNFDPFDWFFGDPRGQQQQPQQDPRNQQRGGQQERRVEGIGSGVIVSRDGYILTNNHVVEDATELTVTLHDRREFSAKIIGTDPPTDLAVIKIEGLKEDLPVAYLGDSESLRVGELVLAIGSPYRLRETVTQGIVSAKGRTTDMGINTYEDFIQTDAAINPGNSGGPLVDMDGAVIGINTAIFSRSGGSQGIGFAIPIGMAKQIMTQLVSEGRVSRGWLGVSIQDIEGELAQSLGVEPYSGVLVSEVIAGTPAAAADLQPGDIILAVEGEKVSSAAELSRKVAMIRPGQKTSFQVLREGKQRSLAVTLAERPSEPLAAGGGGGQAPSLEERTGLSLDDPTPQVRRQYGIEDQIQGVVVTGVDPASPAASQNLREGDVILEVDRQKVSSVNDFNGVVNRQQDNSILLRVQRGGNTFFVPLRLMEQQPQQPKQPQRQPGR